MVFRALRLFKKFFRAESDLKMRFGSTGHNLIHYSGSLRALSMTSPVPVWTMSRFCDG